MHSPDPRSAREDIYGAIMADYADDHRRVMEAWQAWEANPAANPEAAEKIKAYHSLEGMREREGNKADDLIRQALDYFEPGTMTAEDLVVLVSYAGRTFGPQALFVTDRHGLLHPEAYRQAVPYVWGLAEFPGMAMETGDWRRLWRK